jgi:hypothetical protein
MSSSNLKSARMDTPAEAPRAAFPPEELAKRRQTSQRLAWVLGATALAFYVTGFLLKR